MFVCGIAMIANNALVNRLMQSRAPDALRARMMAFYVTVYIGIHPPSGPRWPGGSRARWAYRTPSRRWARCSSSRRRGRSGGIRR
jgi:hypothetical protein